MRWAGRFQNHRAFVAFTALSATLATACSQTPPPRWQEGGASLAIAPARWDRENGDVIEVLPNGQVTRDGKPYLLVDRAGRVVDEDHEPVAILLPDGHVAGPENRLMGRVGLSNAAPPESATAWLAIMPDGGVVYFDDDGERQRGGTWRGCNGPQQRTCTLITHVIAMKNYHSHRHRSGPSFGVGVGIGVGF
jgi:hypothetical protein